MPKAGRIIGTGMVPCKTKLGEFLRSERLKLGLAQTSMAKRFGMNRSVYSLTETGDRSFLSDVQVQNISLLINRPESDIRSLIPERPIIWRGEPKTNLGKLIQRRRTELELTPLELATQMGVPLKVARKLEIGKTPTIKFYLLYPLAKALKLPPSELIEFVSVRTKTPQSDLGQAIRYHRERLDMTQAKLGEKIGMTRAGVSLIELGQIRLSVDKERIDEIAQALGINATELHALGVKRKFKVGRNPKTLGGFLTARRLELRLTQFELAEKAKTSISCIVSIEIGKCVEPNPEIIQKILTALNCEIPPQLH
ncbi:MAG: hypothetical protein G01um101420_624 [Parcubacteria group bacterium Gr01-1014_20]|nr:MAG: hypothetical protein G01um101420_624 [Parcubacteria group bacterium Gr01-1014_20]